ncbi:MAG: hypothetical protein AB7I01_05515 [Gammaproteobacteria bacterium]
MERQVEGPNPWSVACTSGWSVWRVSTRAFRAGTVLQQTLSGGASPAEDRADFDTEHHTGRAAEPPWQPKVALHVIGHESMQP